MLPTTPSLTVVDSALLLPALESLLLPPQAVRDKAKVAADRVTAISFLIFIGYSSYFFDYRVNARLKFSSMVLQEASNSCCSSSVSFNSMMSATPFRLSTAGTLAYTPCWPYWPSR